MDLKDGAIQEVTSDPDAISGLERVKWSFCLSEPLKMEVLRLSPNYNKGDTFSSCCGNSRCTVAAGMVETTKRSEVLVAGAVALCNGQGEEGSGRL